MPDWKWHARERFCPSALKQTLAHSKLNASNKRLTRAIFCYCLLCSINCSPQWKRVNNMLQYFKASLTIFILFFVYKNVNVCPFQLSLGVSDSKIIALFHIQRFNPCTDHNRAIYYITCLWFLFTLFHGIHNLLTSQRNHANFSMRIAVSIKTNRANE